MTNFQNKALVGFEVWRLVLLWSLGFGSWSLLPIATFATESVTLSWTNNLLTISKPDLPSGKLEILYLEAFCRKDSTHRAWEKTVLPHKTILRAADPKHLRFRTTVEPNVEVLHDVRAKADEVEFEFALRNAGEQPVDLEWFQPVCVHVGQFTGRSQSDYFQRSFIFTSAGLTTLDKTERREEAMYHGGQVYVPKGINLDDVNPRPISPDQPANGLIGCFSADGKYLLATAWNSTQELFQGVLVCVHSDPHVGGLGVGETKKLRGKIYLLRNDPAELLKRYKKDFSDGAF